nr:ATP-binding cassette domain-containing protein [uncultured Sellimonas sp.]
MTYSIETENLTKVYKGFAANDGVSLKVPKGSIFGLIGRNGAGKTTLMKMILGFSSKTSGTIRINGKETEEELWKERGKIGSIIEVPAFYDEMSCYENTMYHARLLGIKDKGVVDQVLEEVGLSKFKRRKVKAFSLGMRQKLGIACAVLGNPDILLLDEPTNGLDPVAIAEIRRLLQSLNKKGVTIFISSHILGEMEKIATDYAFMMDGKVIRNISAEELKQTGKDLETYFLDIVGGETDEKDS